MRKMQLETPEEIGFLLVSATDKSTGITGATPTAWALKPDGDEVAGLGTFREASWGWYYYLPHPTELDVLGEMQFHFEATGADDVDRFIEVVIAGLWGVEPPEYTYGSDTITGQMLADWARLILNDATKTRWPDAELLDWLNMGQREIALLKPNVYTRTLGLALVEGTKQVLASHHHALVRVVRNLGASGGTPGPAIRAVERVFLDTAFPEWHLTEYAAATVKGFMTDQADPRTFHVYPPQPTGTTQVIEVTVAMAPPPLASLASVISLESLYAPSLLDYLLFRAFAKDAATSPTNAERSKAAYQRIMQNLGIRTQIDAAYTPDRDASVPAAPAGATA